MDQRRIINGETSFEMATFHCGTSLIEILRPINHPELSKYLENFGPGLHHVGFGVKNIKDKIDKLNDKGVNIYGPFTASTGWEVAYFDFKNSELDLLKSCHHGDHLVEVYNKK